VRRVGLLDTQNAKHRRLSAKACARSVTRSAAIWLSIIGIGRGRQLGDGLQAPSRAQAYADPSGCQNRS
jgi:hypothetical protein